MSKEMDIGDYYEKPLHVATPQTHRVDGDEWGDILPAIDYRGIREKEVKEKVARKRKNKTGGKRRRRRGKSRRKSHKTRSRRGGQDEKGCECKFVGTAKIGITEYVDRYDDREYKGREVTKKYLVDKKFDIPSPDDAPAGGKRKRGGRRTRRKQKRRITRHRRRTRRGSGMLDQQAPRGGGYKEHYLNILKSGGGGRVIGITSDFPPGFRDKAARAAFRKLKHKKKKSKSKKRRKR